MKNRFFSLLKKGQGFSLSSKSEDKNSVDSMNEGEIAPKEFELIAMILKKLEDKQYFEKEKRIFYKKFYKEI